MIDLVTAQEQEILGLRAINGMLQKQLGHVQSLQLTAPQSQQTQPIVNVNIDTGAISQALLLGMKVLIEQQTQTLSDVLRDALESRTITQENGGESLVSQEVSHPLMALSQSESQASGKVSTKSRQEIIAELLLENPTISGREIERRTGIPDATARRILSKLRGD